MILCSVITEGCVVFQFMWFLSSFMRIFKHLSVWPTYDALQSQQSILYTTSVWDSLGWTSLWLLMNPLRLLIPLYAMLRSLLKNVLIFSDKSGIKIVKNLLIFSSLLSIDLSVGVLSWSFHCLNFFHNLFLISENTCYNRGNASLKN